MFIPSTCAVFGPDCPKTNVKPDQVRNPVGYFGVSKLFLENLGYYYNKTYNCDFRSIRYNSVVSPIKYNYNGSTDYPSEVFFKAEKGQEYTFCLAENRTLGMCYIDDIVDGTINLIEAPRERLSQTTYNINACYFSPGEYIAQMKRYYPDLEVKYKPDVRDIYTQTWPCHFDDTLARSDWGWNPQYDSVGKIVDAMFSGLQLRKQWLEQIKKNKELDKSSDSETDDDLY